MNSDGGHHDSDGGSYTMQHEDLFTFGWIWFDLSAVVG